MLLKKSVSDGAALSGIWLKIAHIPYGTCFNILFVLNLFINVTISLRECLNDFANNCYLTLFWKNVISLTVTFELLYLKDGI